MSRTAAEKKKHLLLGRSVCQNAFRRILGIGAQRYSRLYQAAKRGLDAPLDGRSVPRKGLGIFQKESYNKRQIVIEFLEGLYHTVSEPMPEASSSLKRPVDGPGTEPDDAKGKATLVRMPKVLKFRRRRGRRPRQVREALKGQDSSGIRLLPPGSYSDYFMLFQAKHPVPKISRKLFTTVTWQDRWLST